MGLQVGGIIAASSLMFSIAASVIITPKGDFITNCFTDEDDGNCEYSRVKICGDFYACDMAIHFQSPIKRIGYIDKQILIAEGTNTYEIDTETHQANHIKKIIPPVNEFVDKHGNKYYSGGGTTYVGLNETGKEIEIITTGEYSSNQLALDYAANRLFILTFMKNDKKDTRLGYLFALTLDKMNIEEDKIHAEKVEGDDSITAMAIQGDFEKLLLGTSTEKGSKLIRLNRLQVDPCSSTEIHQTAIREVVNEASFKLLKIFEDSDSFAKKSCLTQQSFVRESSKSSSTAIVSTLKEELNITISKLALCTDRVLSLKTNESSSAIEYENKHDGFYNERKSCSDGLFKNSHQHDDDENDKHDEHQISNHGKVEKTCLPTSEIECMKNRIKELEKCERNLRKELERYTKGIDAILKEPLLKDQYSKFYGKN